MAGVVSAEKANLEHLEDGSKSEGSEEMFTPKQASAIRRRIDFRLIPALGFMYGISLMDRKNVSNAAIAGMRKDLDLLEGYRYSLITLSFFITYVLFQPPMTVSCRKVGPRIFLPGICLLWGALIIGFGFAQNWTTMVALRLILGILEAGYFPGCVYLLSTWYTRFEVARRYSVFYLIGSLASALSGILAFGLMQMEGLQGIRVFLPIILRDNMGFSMAASQCLVAPPYAFAAILMFTTAYLADRFKIRFPFIVLNSVISLVGLPLMGFHSNSGVRYFGAFIGAAGVNANVPLIMAYQANNIRGQWKRAFCSATLTGFGGIGGIAGSLVFRTQDSPEYLPGIIATMTCCVAVIITLAALTVYFKRQNKRADQGEIVIGDSPGFRYTL
ncbi:hypothetical protein FQN53_001005 [Emmonsiellopsis sp. PD_33]|nr:hypothetical protein FQN53_001005 [Emmonsiellopsis sp. PD_33]